MRTLLDRFPELRPASDEFEWRNTLQLRGPQTPRRRLVTSTHSFWRPDRALYAFQGRQNN